MRAPVKYFSYTFERILASSIPNLQLENLLFQFNKKCTKLDSYCHFMIRLKLIVCQSMQQARFTDC